MKKAIQNVFVTKLLENTLLEIRAAVVRTKKLLNSRSQYIPFLATDEVDHMKVW